MGMFDYVKSEFALPSPEPMMDDEFQTKDIDCNLDRYVIDINGKLWVQKFCSECCTIGDREPSMFHGMLYFYGHTKSTGRPKKYKAKFTNGQLEIVELVLNEKEKNKPGVA